MTYIDTALKGKKKISSIQSEGKNKFTQFLWLQVIIIIIIMINYFPSVRSCKTIYMNNKEAQHLHSGISRNTRYLAVLLRLTDALKAFQ